MKSVTVLLCLSALMIRSGLRASGLKCPSPLIKQRMIATIHLLVRMIRMVIIAVTVVDGVATVDLSLAVRNDGTVDVSKGAQVMYVSPSKVSSPSKTVRKDSIRKYVFTSSFVDHSRKWNATNQWKGVEAPALPTCTIKQLAKNLEKEGLTAGKTVRISFDPSFDWGAEQVWHVRGEDPKIDQSYSFKDCSKVDKNGAPTGKGDAAGGEGEGGDGDAE